MKNNNAGIKSNKGSRERRRLLLAVGIGIPLCLLWCIYLGVAVFFMSHFCFNTSVNGKEAYGKTPEQLKSETLSEAASYRLLVKGRNDLSAELTSSQIELSPRLDGVFEELLDRQNAFLWPVSFFKATDFQTETVVDYSEQELERVIGAMPFFETGNIIEPVDASLKETEQGFEIEAEQEGCVPIKDRITDEIEEAVNILADSVELSDECYEKAAVTAENEQLNELKDSLNVYCSAYITYHFGDESVVVGPEQIREWCDIDGSSVTLNEEKVRGFVNSLAKEHDTFGISRKLKSHSGETIEVSGGDYGWWMNRAEETSQLIEAIKNGEHTDRTPVYFQEAKSYGDPDFGNSYVEINLTDQHLWVYVEGSIVEEADFVSGCVNKRTTTPTGTYSITYKERDATLNGQGYSSPVSYWMPFNGNVGMHDASWRSKFGGDLYVTGGSHGCINLPKKKAESIYSIVEKGFPVIVYGGKTLPEVEEEPEEETLTPEQQLLLMMQLQQAAGAGTGEEVQQ